MGSLLGPVAVAGSRRLPPAGALLAQRVALALARSGRQLVVGCCTGADAAVLALAASKTVPPGQVSVFAAFGPCGLGSCALSAVSVVRAAAAAGVPVSWWSGGRAAVPLRGRLARRARAVVAASPGGLVLVLSSPASGGSLRAARMAADSGFPVLVFPVGFAPDRLPLLGLGQWVQAAPRGLWALAVRWQPHM